MFDDTPYPLPTYLELFKQFDQADENEKLTIYRNASATDKRNLLNHMDQCKQLAELGIIGWSDKEKRWVPTNE